MDPTSGGNLADLLGFLQGGGSVATVIIVWLAFQLKTVVQKTFESITLILGTTQETLKKLIERVDVLEREVEKLNDKVRS